MSTSHAYLVHPTKDFMSVTALSSKMYFGTMWIKWNSSSLWGNYLPIIGTAWRVHHNNNNNNNNKDLKSTQNGEQCYIPAMASALKVAPESPTFVKLRRRIEYALLTFSWICMQKRHRKWILNKIDHTICIILYLWSPGSSAGRACHSFLLQVFKSLFSSFILFAT